MSPRGRRPADQDTRGAIVEAARAEFAAGGYDGTSMRAVARRAEVDPALVHHYFDGKAGLFAEVMDIPVRPEMLVRAIAEGPLEEVGERMVRTFISVWDSPEGRARFQTIMRSAVTHDDAAHMLREFVVGAIFGNLLTELAATHPTVSTDNLPSRAAMAASQMVGVGLLRYVVELPAMVAADPEELVRLLAPVLQMYLVG